jgi:hypothetical protein
VQFSSDLGIFGEETVDVLAGRALPYAGRLRRVWLDLVDEGLATNALERQDCDLLAAQLKGTLRTVFRWARESSGATRTPAAMAQLVVDLFLRGARRRTKKKG